MSQQDQHSERLTATDEPGAPETEEALADAAAARVEREDAAGELESDLEDPSRDVGTPSEGEGGITAEVTTPVLREKEPRRDLSGGGELPTAPGESAGTGGTA